MKKLYNTSIYVMVIGLVFWILETIVFLFIDGWHYKAISESEIFLDLVSQIIMRIGWFMWMISAASLVNKIYKNL